LEFSEVVQRRRMVRHYSSRLLAPEANGQAVAGGAVTALRRARMRRERVTSSAKQMSGAQDRIRCWSSVSIRPAKMVRPSHPAPAETKPPRSLRRSRLGEILADRRSGGSYLRQSARAPFAWKGWPWA
jgi:hypothetical protein